MDMVVLQERLDALRAALIAEAAAFTAITDDGTDPELTYGKIAFDLIHACEREEDAQLLHMRLMDLEADLMNVIPKHVSCLPVVQSVVAAEAIERGDTDDPFYKRGNYLFFDAQVEYALTRDDETEHRLLLGYLAGSKDGDCRTGMRYTLHTSGDATFGRKSRVAAGTIAFNPNSQIIVKHFAGGTIKTVPRFTPAVLKAMPTGNMTV